ncbi:TBC1 domain family member 9B [Dissostichus eleginoides]|uniref:TBC1 domain family member 9B n=1 Tax=Dissostichus eleginoides TaxID=100907 RepID=A0AAD9CMR0_DISEL|nr:TBC1 domain family member 9B [Dissostichus eleginoides]
MYHGEMTEKLKLLYKLHLPPAVCPEEAESALEATHSFTENEAEGEEDVGNEERKGPEEKVKDYRYYLRLWAKEKEPKTETIKNLPRMNQEQFIDVCKTLYNMFSEDPEEQQLYHSIATAASLLLRIGEVGKRFGNRKSEAPPPEDQPPESPPTEGPPPEAPPPEGPPPEAPPPEGPPPEAPPPEAPGEGQVCRALEDAQLEDVSSSVSLQDEDSALIAEQRQGSELDADWSISFEQVLASLLTEPPLVHYFERKRDIRSKMAACKAQRAVERQTSSASEHDLTHLSA